MSVISIEEVLKYQSFERRLMNEMKLHERTMEKQKHDYQILNNERNELLSKLERISSELAELRKQYQTAVDEVNFLRHEKEKVQQAFLVYRKEKDSEFAELRRQKEKLGSQTQVRMLLPAEKQSPSSVAGSLSPAFFGAVSSEGVEEMEEEEGEETDSDLIAVIGRRIASLESQRKKIDNDWRHATRATKELGTLYFRQGDFPTASALFGQAVELKRKLLGDQFHPDLCRELASLATATLKMEDWPTAEHCYREIMRIREKNFGLFDKVAMESRQKLLRLLHKQSKWAEQEALLLRLIELYDSDKRIALAVSCRCQLATVYSQNSDGEKAQALLNQALTTCLAHLPKGSSVTAAVRKVHAKIFSQSDSEKESDMQLTAPETFLDVSDENMDFSSSSLAEHFVLSPAPPGKGRRCSK